ncbi:uncharacterized protein PHALS_13201 [Plasmopara halstedii]|uniref:Uncharacterized protein n=1 Tax=Plasmopara halstedii TaxID=4781 RepID=A0A0P1AP71_PLAHL|nr:uncharacterized protein PHALS_13201 [Plasmopara halstedii]CEG42969.1 hypothetical protein PHALS_13201 [Plasmopara halstedii]|eukprot:XP_024579338.1 hypothetical protein PHALS_13201 [Plasmopara halstedii]
MEDDEESQAQPLPTHRNNIDDMEGDTPNRSHDPIDTQARVSAIKPPAPVPVIP